MKHICMLLLAGMMVWAWPAEAQVRDAEVAYALPIDGPVAPVLGNEVPVGPVAVVDPSYDIGFRAGGNFALSPGASLAAQYTRFRSEDSNSVTVTAPDVLRSLVSHPLGANAVAHHGGAALRFGEFVRGQWH